MCRHRTQAGMHNMWMCGQMRPLVLCLAISRVAYRLYIGMACMYILPLTPRTWLQHYDGNVPLLGHLIDAGAMGR